MIHILALGGRLTGMRRVGPRHPVQEARPSRHQGNPRLCPEGHGEFWRCAALAIGLSTDTATIQGTRDVRLDPQLNKKVWESGIKGVPFRLRVRISRRRNDEEGAKEKLYSYVQAVNVKNPRGLQTQVVEDE
jgi:large subunit ribosomal protein L31e